MVVPFRADSLISRQVALGAQGADLYVDAVLGDDDNDGLTPATPIKTCAQLARIFPSRVTQDLVVHFAAGVFDALKLGNFSVDDGVSLFFRGERVISDNWIPASINKDALTITNPGASWSVDEHAKKFLVLDVWYAEYYYPTYVPIVSNTADTLTLAVPIGTTTVPVDGVYIMRGGTIFEGGDAPPFTLNTPALSLSAIPMTGYQMVLQDLCLRNGYQFLARFDNIGGPTLRLWGIAADGYLAESNLHGYTIYNTFVTLGGNILDNFSGEGMQITGPGSSVSFNKMWVRRRASGGNLIRLSNKAQCYTGIGNLLENGAVGFYVSGGASLRQAYGTSPAEYLRGTMSQYGVQASAGGRNTVAITGTGHTLSGGTANVKVGALALTWTDAKPQVDLNTLDMWTNP